MVPVPPVSSGSVCAEATPDRADAIATAKDKMRMGMPAGATGPNRYGKIRSILRQSFCAAAHVLVQSGAWLSWSGTCAGQKHPR